MHQQPPMAGEEPCPFLGLEHDPWTHFSFPDEAHRCHAKKKLAAIDTRFQAEFCLTGAHPTCARFQDSDRPVPLPARPTASSSGPSAASPSGPPDRPPLEPAAPTLPLTPTVPPQRPPDARPAEVKSQAAPSRGRRTKITSLGRVLLLTGLAVTAIGAIALVVLGSAPRGGGQLIGGGPSPTPAAAIEPATTPKQGVSPSPATPTASPTAAVMTIPPTPTQTLPPPTVPPTPSVVVHTVRRGETLAEIAALYGVTVRQIVRANDLEDPTLIVPGQRLVIPNAEKSPRPSRR